MSTPAVSRHGNPALVLAPAVFLLLWSGGYPAGKVALRYADPMTLLAVRYAAAFVLLLPVAVYLAAPLPRGRDWLRIALIGGLIQGGYFGFAYQAMHFGVSAGAVALIVSMQPVLTGLLAPAMVGERVSARRWLGLLLGLLGAGLVIYARSALEVTSAVGVGFAVVSLACMTVATLLEKRFAMAVHPVTANLIQYATGIVAVLPVALLLEPMHIAWTPPFLAAFGYLVIGNSIIAITLLLAMVRAGEAARVSALMFMVPPGAALIAFFLLGEAMPPLAWAGMAVAVAGVALATMPARAK